MSNSQNSSNQPYQSTKGDLMLGTGSGGRPAILGIGANGTVPIADSTQTTGVRWGSNSPSGGVVQQVFASSNTQTRLDTNAGSELNQNTPSISAGTQLLSVTLTPQNSSNFLWIQFTCCVQAVASGNLGECTIALFQDATTPGFFSVFGIPTISTQQGGVMNLSGSMRITAGTTSPTTISMNGGSPVANTNLTANSGGGALTTTLIVTEISA